MNFIAFTMKRAVIYARYSPGPNQTEQSIEGQIRECMKYAEQHDLRVIKTYIDRKVSGRTDNRREFQHMMEDSGKKIFDVIILYHTDRFARNRYDSAIYKHQLKQNGVELRYATADIPAGPEGIILESIMEGWAEYYSAELSRKIKRGMRESALKCHSTGAGRCLGYQTAEDKSLVIEPKGAKAVQTVFDMYIDGKSHVEICNYLNDLGFRTAQGKPFNKNSVNHIIRNKRYIGTYTYDDIVIEDGIPPIISKDTFQLAQLEAKRRKNSKRPNAPKAEYMLSGKAFCGHCKSPLVGVSGTGKTGNKWYYDDKLLIYYNVSRDGETRIQSDVELLEEALAGEFDQRSSRSTKSEPDEHSADPLYGWRRVRFGLRVTKMKRG